MSKWHNKALPVAKGSFKGCLRVKWRPMAEAKFVIGYLPPGRSEAETAARKASYDAHEASAWKAGELPDAPEVHFADQIEKMVSRQAEKKEALGEQLAERTATKMTIAEWIGTKEAPGKFWLCTKKKGNKTSGHYFRLVEQLGSLANKPVKAISEEDLTAYVLSQMACEACTERAKATGLSPTAAQLVPYIDVDPFDGEPCSQHHTPLAEGTHDHTYRRLTAIFNAAKSDAAVKQVGQRVVEFNPMPSKAALFEDVEWLPRGAEELRHGLTQGQVDLQTLASPAGYEAIPLALVYTLNRGGQEFGGMNIGDISVIERSDTGGLAGRIEIRNFFTVRNGARAMSKKGKTTGATRTVYVPHWVIKRVVEHIQKYRATPSKVCAACQDGHRHWGLAPGADHNTNPHVGCDFAADAPLWVKHGTKQRLNPQFYTNNIWHPLNEAAGLTEANLGWTPQVKHSRSTGSTLHIDAGTDVDEVVRLGGWADRKMLMEHYERHRPGKRAAMAVQAFDEADELSPKRLMRRLEDVSGRLEKAMQLLEQHGIEYNPTPIPLPKTKTFAINAESVLAALFEMTPETAYATALVRTINVASAGGNRELLSRALSELGVPMLPTGKLPHGSNSKQRAEWYELVTEWLESRAA